MRSRSYNPRSCVVFPKIDHSVPRKKIAYSSVCAVCDSRLSGIDCFSGACVAAGVVWFLAEIFTFLSLLCMVVFTTKLFVYIYPLLIRIPPFPAKNRIQPHEGASNLEAEPRGLKGLRHTRQLVAACVPTTKTIFVAVFMSGRKLRQKLTLEEGTEEVHSKQLCPSPQRASVTVMFPKPRASKSRNAGT